jgi:hypothetical protein
MSEFYAYDNHHRDRATVHRSECPWCNHGRGVQGSSNAANDQWHGPFSSAEDASARAAIAPMSATAPSAARRARKLGRAIQNLCMPLPVRG